jgi:integrase
VQRYRERSRDRFLQADELPRFFESLARASQPARDFFTVALFTGARRANVQSMKWADVNLERKEWRIPETKNGRPVVVPLVAPVVDVLTRRAGAGGEYVFPGSGKSGHYHEPSRAWRAICKRAGLADLRIHDLRRTLGSWQAGTGASTAVIGKSLGHQSTASTAVYARLALGPVRDSVERATAAIIEASRHARQPDGPRHESSRSGS